MSLSRWSGGVEVEESRSPSLVVPKSAQLHTTGVSGCPSRTSASLDPGAISEILGIQEFRIQGRVSGSDFRVQSLRFEALKLWIQPCAR